MDTSSLIWTEKYRPKTLSDYYMNKSQLDKVKDWLSDLKSEKSEKSDNGASVDVKPFLVLYGTAGVGKTTLAHLILQKSGYEIIECNASDTRSRKQIRETIGGISGVTVVMDEKNKFKKTAIIMDEIDGLNGITESSGIQELIDTVMTLDKKTKEIKWVCPVICTSNSIKEKKIQLLLRYGVLINIGKPSDADVTKLINKIAKAEGFQVSSPEKSNIITRANGDYRQVIHLLYNLYNDQKFKLATPSTLAAANVTNNQSKDIKERDKYKEEYEAHIALVRNINNIGETPLDKINYFLTHEVNMDIIRYFCSGDSNLYFMNFYNNIIPALQAIQEKTKGAKTKDTYLAAYKDVIKCYMSVRDADLLNNSIFIDKNWDLLEYFDLFSVGSPARCIYNANRIPCSGTGASAGDNKRVWEFNLTHHTQYNFMRQEQVLNRKLINSDYLQTMDNDVANIYYNLKRFENDNADLVSRKANTKSKKKSPTARDDDIAKYNIDKSYCKILNKIDELLS